MPHKTCGQVADCTVTVVDKLVISTGEVVVIEQYLIFEGSPDTISFYLADMDANSFRINTQLHEGIQYMSLTVETLNSYRVVKRGDIDGSVLSFFLNNEAIIGRIEDAFKHAIEIAPPSPNSQEDEIF